VSVAPLSPLVVVTSWGIAGVPLLGGVLLACAAGAAAYWRVLRQTHPVSLKAACAVAALAIAAAWFVPVLFSSDVYAYAAYGEMARIGLNPYALAPVDSADGLVRAAQAQWVTAFPICLYGPAFVALARFFVTTLAPFGPLAQLEAFRVAASAAFLLCVPLAYFAFQGDRTQRSRAAATIGLNPAAIWCAAEGHNDAIALAVVLAGFVFVHRRLLNAGALVVALSSLIKPPGMAAAIGLAIVDRRARISALAGIAIAVALSFPLVAGVATQLAPHGAYAPQASLQAVFRPLGPFVSCAAALVAGALLARRGIALLAGRLIEGWIWLGLAAWVLVPNPYPWYALWLVALAALAPRSRAGAVAILLSLTALLRYVPDAIAIPSPPLAVALGIATTLPLLALCYNKRPA
jgi:alpha-1,6-mannosyltransferase